MSDQSQLAEDAGRLLPGDRFQLETAACPGCVDVADRLVDAARILEDDGGVQHHALFPLLAV